MLNHHIFEKIKGRKWFLIDFVLKEELSGCLPASEDLFEKLVMRIGDLVHKPTLSHQFGGSRKTTGVVS